MNKKGYFLIFALAILFLVFSINTSFATSETIYQSSDHQLDTYDKKIVTLKVDTLSYKLHETKQYLKIEVKKGYRNKYKIKSYKIKFSDKKAKLVKVNNKKYIKIKVPLYNSLSWIKINYLTKGKVKKESTSFKNSKFRVVKFFKGKKSNVKIIQEGITDYINGENFPTINYQKIKITAKNKKSKINQIKLLYRDYTTGEEGSKIFYGHGRNSLTTNLYGTYYGYGFDEVIVRYY
ncbi:hypothetical protein [Methanobrevibacter curvatus]|uniref:Uncharacterized protein n=1 Tax=Methanobrevibacter curvatus TaxID=49547 RepID=A0A165Z0L7_9EURY|nr:hypothetical protein [Methanobrevibacter curvatus]KZX10098.1 hypothetical protein MBCUR_19240 [Methanobrevibacter curvatus]